MKTKIIRNFYILIILIKSFSSVWTGFPIFILYCLCHITVHHTTCYWLNSHVKVRTKRTKIQKWYIIFSCIKLKLRKSNELSQKSSPVQYYGNNKESNLEKNEYFCLYIIKYRCLMAATFIFTLYTRKT